MAATEKPVIETPCVKVCVMDARAGLCLGCGRRIDEIGGWASMSAAERARIMAELPQRMRSMPAADAVG